MKPCDTKAGIVNRRALLIVGVLISLCLSDNVGPRLMPLPVAEGVEASAASQQSTEPAASRIPSPAKGSGPRVEMAATAQNRAGTRHPQAHAATHAPQGGVVVPEDIIRNVSDAHGPIVFFTTPASRPPGRAPPRLV